MTIFDPRADLRQSIRLVHFEEYDELIARIFSQNGSSPIALVLNGQPVPDAEVGRRFREAVLYLCQSEESHDCDSGDPA